MLVLLPAELLRSPESKELTSLGDGGFIIPSLARASFLGSFFFINGLDTLLQGNEEQNGCRGVLATMEPCGSAEI